MPLVHKYALTALAVAVSGAALFGVGTAAADTPLPLNGPLVNSTCSFGQLDRALHAEAPDIAAKLDANPDRKAKLQQLFDQPVDQRKAAITQFLTAHPDKVAQMQQHAAADPAKAGKAKAMMDQLAQTCHNY